MFKVNGDSIPLPNYAIKYEDHTLRPPSRVFLETLIVPKSDFMESECSLPCSQELTPVMDPIHNLSSRLFKVHFDIIL
jgi:hypothetical protein